MEFSKEAFIALKSDIKIKVKEQREYRPQRKTVHFTGVRTVDAGTAQFRHALNRYSLRYLYLAYAIVRGKTIQQVENKCREDNKPSTTRIETIINQYEQAVRDNEKRLTAA